jgi:3-hydroxyacyl-[acyl-carrier-protein] dehydratase
MTIEIDIGKVLESLPHRYPFLLIDRVLDIVEDEKIVALKNVSINEPFFQGHFPQMPIMPGVLIVEAMGQAGGILIVSNLPPTAQARLFYFMGFDKVRFRKPVTPGDQLILELKLLKKRRKVVKMAGTAFVDQNVVAEAELLATFGDQV